MSGYYSEWFYCAYMPALFSLTFAFFLLFVFCTYVSICVLFLCFYGLIPEIIAFIHSFIHSLTHNDSCIAKLTGSEDSVRHVPSWQKSQRSAAAAAVAAPVRRLRLTKTLKLRRCRTAVALAAPVRHLRQMPKVRLT